MKSETSKKRVRLNYLAYVGVATVLIWALYSATMSEMARVPDREATANMESYGFVTIRFRTDPHPPNPDDIVILSFRPMDSRQNSVKVDQISYAYGPDGSEKATGSGSAQLMPNNGGAYVGDALFPYVGRWWITAKITIGDVQNDVRFTVNVEPTQ